MRSYLPIDPSFINAFALLFDCTTLGIEEENQNVIVIVALDKATHPTNNHDQDHDPKAIQVPFCIAIVQA
jgi:hypothetical protein